MTAVEQTEPTARSASSARHAPAVTSRRGRPSRERAEALHRSIIDVARTMFLAAGYSVTSMDAVAARAGISKGTLYSRFSSKSELFTAIVKDRVAAWARHDDLPRLDGGGLKALIERHVLITLDSLADPELAAFVDLIAAERTRFPELARIYYDTALSVEVELLTADIEAGAKTEGLVIRAADSVAYTLLQAALGWWNMQVLAGPPPDAHQRAAAARRIAELIADGRAAW